MPATQSRPRGRPPMPCSKINTVTHGRKKECSKKDLRTKLCAKRSKTTYLPYRCDMTSTGC